MWENLDLVVQSEVSQKEKRKYHILMRIYRESKKHGTGTDEPICRAEIQTERTGLWTRGKGNVEQIGRVGLTCTHHRA